MSAIATTPVSRRVRFYEAAAGKKVVMAVTGVILFGYVLAHMLGNLQILTAYQFPGDAELHGVPASVYENTGN